MKHFLFLLFALPLVLVSCNPDEDDCELSGCMDPDAVNFNTEATVDDGSCVSALNPCSDGSTSVLFDGYSYNLVGIGDQCWFAENLRNEHYANGDVIPGELSNSAWANTNIGAQAIYGEGSSTVDSGSDDEVANLTDYGRLYNWYAVDDSRGLCPSGWHVPTDGEFMTLEMELGMSESEANGTGMRGTDQGTQMKSSPEDSPSWNGTNSSGFSGLAGGQRFSLGDFYSGGWIGNFYSASVSVSLPWARFLDPAPMGVYTQVFRITSNSKRDGFSVRCVRD
jgi:uncharacterized protein (TIGR02145 family)